MGFSALVNARLQLIQNVAAHLLISSCFPYFSIISLAVLTIHFGIYFRSLLSLETVCLSELLQPYVCSCSLRSADQQLLKSAKTKILWELCFLAQLPLYHNRVVQRPHNCGHRANLHVSLMLWSSLTRELDPETLKLLHLGQQHPPLSGHGPWPQT